MRVAALLLTLALSGCRVIDWCDNKPYVYDLVPADPNYAFMKRWFDEGAAVPGFCALHANLTDSAGMKVGERWHCTPCPERHYNPPAPPFGGLPEL